MVRREDPLAGEARLAIHAFGPHRHARFNGIGLVLEHAAHFDVATVLPLAE